ncbi:uncharacterized protein MYCGRDRAFT_82615, partial [Zymoseptoria tritici IPO323]
MIKEAIISLKERSGSSRQALKKYVQANNSHLAGVTDASFTSNFNKALTKGAETGVFDRPKGPSGPVKLAGGAKKAAEPKPKTAKAPAAAKKATTAAKPAAAKKTTAAKKAPAAKKTAAAKKAPAAKKTATKTATKSKANTSKVRKTPAAAPAVV